MFTGIVEEIGRVRGIEFPDGAGRDAVLTVEGPLATSDAGLGDSIAVNGVCLTVTSLGGDGSFTADVMPESLRRTALGDLVAGSPVNLERAVRADARLGGHVVQGHVDGVGALVSRSPGERWDDLVFSAPEGLTRYVAEKGSIAVSGVSLTVTHVDEETFGVSLIPTTLEATILGGLTPGDRVNLEVDVLAKYVERLLVSGVVAGRAS
ncbi:riboflavin synthase [Cellulosimicrobium sp. BIT-GX5]|uniref:Riboflavin synthase n=1 Tax=Cellulosimicrobium composti TaxID=2672572 RepID=A0A6N7ZII9_9MICO|nr:riboflavin synthase [Cellulosimicrobium composti]MTG89232.1 riboflavin synthase [Cellulosimicrobium composti]TWG86540.1 riboflavin synthase alpha chain [Cellulosimicrobium cellulans J34]SMF01425.1 riboflavin synthase alpha chain [Cellulosimicrobium cellulans J1]